MERLIFHVDVNSAFLSWEATRRVNNGEPDLRLIPSCVGGSPDSRRSVVVAKSIPAKKFDIKTGEPVSTALKKCPGLVVVQSDFRLYKACSKAFTEGTLILEGGYKVLTKDEIRQVLINSL